MLKHKLGFLRRTLTPSDTLASVLFLEDWVVDFPAGFGFSNNLLSLLMVYGLPELAYCDSKSDVARALELVSTKESILSWERMSTAKSTKFLCSVFVGPSQFFDAALFASSINLTALRIFLLMWTGSVSIHLFGSHERLCRFCSKPLDSRHYLGCSFHTCLFLQLIVMARNSRFEELVRFTSQCDFSFMLQSKPLSLTEELLLFDMCLDS